MATDASRATRIVLAVSLLGALLWLLAIFLAPALQSRSFSRAAGFIYALFAPTCHQIPERCFVFCGHPLAVCGRCLGVYAGFLGGLLAYPFVRGFSQLRLPSTMSFLLLSIPIGLDAAGGILGIWASPIGIRFATGFLWGAILPFYLVTGLAELLMTRRAKLPLKDAYSDQDHLESGPVVEKRPEKGVE
jgi:uncharacterized membrane protein